MHVPIRYRPSLEEFAEFAKQGNVVPVYRQLLADTLTPVSAYQKLSAAKFSFLLESAEGGDKIARYSFLGSDPFLILRAQGRNVEVARGEQVECFQSDDPLEDMERLLKPYSPVRHGPLPPFTGGAVGYAGYDAVRYIERLPNVPQDTLGLPDIYFAFYDTMVIFDHLNKTMMVVCNARLDEQRDAAAAYVRAIQRVNEVVERLRTPVIRLSDDIAPAGDVKRQFDSNFTREGYMQGVEKCKEYIRAGDIIQVVLSQRLSAETAAQPFDIYRYLRAVNPSPYMFYLRMDDLSLVGSSPEVMVKMEEGKVTIRPIAGTRPRGRSEEEDQDLAEDLLADPKERAEHIMLLDLGRNDVGKVSEFGTVKVEECMIIERFSHVMHMTSTVTGRLRKDLTAFDALRSGFPAGTVSGAPKIRAMEIIDELEPEKRGPYAGGVGYFDFAGNFDMCIAIRTIVIKGKRAYVQAGAGIVADSVPEKEHQETLNKARALFRAIEIAEEGIA
jgi:anthranilate synthase component I